MGTENEDFFPPEKEWRISQKICEALSMSGNPPDVIPKENFKVMDPATVMAIQTKTKAARRILMKWYDTDHPQQHAPITSMNWETKFGEVTTSAFHTEYLRKAIPILEASANDEKIWFTTKKEHPIRIENEHFVIVIAPRVQE